MTLKLGPLPAGKPSKLTLSLTADDTETLDAYAAMHAEEFGAAAPKSELARLMIRQFLKSDAAFQRARKKLHQPANGKD